MTKIQQLETRITKLEAALRERQSSIAAHPAEMWMVRAKPLPGETWPTSNSTRIFDGILMEPVYTPGVSTDYTASELGDLTDAAKGMWIKFRAPTYVYENTDLQVWRPNQRGNNWYAESPSYPVWLSIAQVQYSGNTGGTIQHGTTSSPGDYRAKTVAAPGTADKRGELIASSGTLPYFELLHDGFYTFWYMLTAQMTPSSGTPLEEHYGRLYPILRRDRSDNWATGGVDTLAGSEVARVLMIYTRDDYHASHGLSSVACCNTSFWAEAGDQIYLSLWFQQLTYVSDQPFDCENVAGDGTLFRHPSAASQAFVGRNIPTNILGTVYGGTFERTWDGGLGIFESPL